MADESLYSEAHRVDKYRAIFYAAASGDFNPIHIDPSVGEKAGFGGPILHGLCTAAWMVDSVSRHVGDPTAIKSMGCRFSAPVRLGDTVTCEGLVHEVADGDTTYAVSAKIQDDTDVLRKARVTVKGVK
jgi:3-hydroxybutyryl-CoA dehydratase